MKRRARAREAYTLLELAVAVAIMGSMAAMIAPGVGELMADNRASSVAEDMVRLSRVVRARVNDTGLAHLLLFQASNDAAGSRGLGRVRVWEGMNNHCTQTPWQQAISGTPEDGFSPVETIDLGDSAYNVPIEGRTAAASDTGRQVVRMFASTNAALAILCFEPGGDTWTGVTNTTSVEIGFTFVRQTEAEIFTVVRSVSSSSGTTLEHGVRREVIFPAGGNGRLRF